MDTWFLAVSAFLITTALILWRPGGVHEAIPALIGAFVMFLVGLVDRQDVLQVMAVVWNAALTIISTFIMASVLEGAGFFRWVAARLTARAAGSGQRLFHLVLAFSACLTLFLNNDGSILIGTPVVIGLVTALRLPRRATLGCLLGACLVASAASAAIAVSNMANLEAMQLVGIALTEHTQYVLLPAIIGLATCWGLLYAIFARDLPRRLDPAGQEPTPERAAPPRRAPPPGPPPAHPLLYPPPPRPPHPAPPAGRHPRAHPDAAPKAPDVPLMVLAVTVIVLVRAGFFAASLVAIPAYLVAAAGAVLLLAANLCRPVVHAPTAVRAAPWPILGFAFGMDLVVFGLRNAGLTGLLASWLGPVVAVQPNLASLIPGTLSATVSSLLNNHPGLIIGSLTLNEMAGLSHEAVRIAYASIVLGADLGALLTPIGTLASLLWFHLLHRHHVRCSWWEYFRVTALVIPISFAFALAGLLGFSYLVLP